MVRTYDFRLPEGGAAVSSACVCALVRCPPHSRSSLNCKVRYVIGEIAKDNENDQSNHPVTLLCVLHFGIDLQQKGRQPASRRFRLPHTPRGSETWALQDVARLLIYLKDPVLRDHLDPKNSLGLSYMDHIKRKRRGASKVTSIASDVRRPLE